jgi:hypothetical protein
MAHISGDQRVSTTISIHLRSPIALHHADNTASGHDVCLLSLGLVFDVFPLLLGLLSLSFSQATRTFFVLGIIVFQSDCVSEEYRGIGFSSTHDLDQ